MDILECSWDGQVNKEKGSKEIGGVLRNYKKEVVGVVAKGIGEAWAYEAEVQAIHHALLFCCQFKISTIVIESDSTLAVGWVNNRERRPWKLYQVLHSIDQLILQVNCLSVSHILREGNGVADFLAKLGRDSDEVLWGVGSVPILADMV